MRACYRVVRPFKYGKKQYKTGDEFIPKGGKWDHQITDPEHNFVRLETIADEPEGFTCPDCGRVFKKKQGLVAHSRFCKGK